VAAILSPSTLIFSRNELIRSREGTPAYKKAAHLVSTLPGNWSHLMSDDFD
jgi:hypothetical protein